MIGLFLSGSVAGVTADFPMPLIAGMMLLAGIELAKPMLGLRGWKLGVALATAGLSVATSMAVGFAVGLALAHLLPALTK